MARVVVSQVYSGTEIEGFFKERLRFLPHIRILIADANSFYIGRGFERFQYIIVLGSDIDRVLGELERNEFSFTIEKELGDIKIYKIKKTRNQKLIIYGGDLTNIEYYRWGDLLGFSDEAKIIIYPKSADAIKNLARREIEIE